jgi:membrane protein implicated in regulation of membrane protease activity
MVSFVIMGIGLVTFLSTPIWLQFGIDVDIPGFFTLMAGIAIFNIGLIRRKKLSGVKLVVLVVLTSVLSIPMLFLIASLIYYFITGEELGW